MTEVKALALVMAATLLLAAVCILGLGALGAEQLGIALGAIVPLAFAAHGVTRVVLHYSESDPRKH
ncbi:MAG TPA: hypothetical protein VGO36_03825 [Solirubrobacterales bacterium]|jgi:hypothetical protein|nr:hypothetical protein [Solirubrobacterales bacterium]